jgi:hypothetical protein
MNFISYLIAASSLSKDAQGTTISKLLDANSRVSANRKIMYTIIMSVEVNRRMVCKELVQEIPVFTSIVSSHRYP